MGNDRILGLVIIMISVLLSIFISNRKNLNKTKWILGDLVLLAGGFYIIVI
ncbi:hypothetical protein [Clostridium rectalis]|uniref:hypothetical protein n=1 Tax=Clostridium rectalis TaxID=2040295 RepID=UPI0013DE52A9|nr:hypothetical protein [Clostridium rectalis]